MNSHRMVQISKYLSLHLRHKPQRLGLVLGPKGMVEVEHLLQACARDNFPISRDELLEVVEKSDKQRFSFDETGTQIGANQGHSVDVDLQLEPCIPPAVLYHGTVDRFVPPILSEGLRKMKRRYVHLSADQTTAWAVGSRRGKPVVFIIDTAAMLSDGFTFYRSSNGVWLVDRVPPQYLRPS